MSKSKVLNLPNTLSLLRVIMVPLFLAAAVFLKPFGIWGRLVPAALFGLASLTDMLDGKIARKYGLVTNFGKFIDPLADKFMVFGAMLGILFIEDDPVFRIVFLWAAAIVIFRELAVTSLRLLIAGSSGKVMAASMWGKVKTCTQIAAILIIFLEPVPGLLGAEIAALSEWHLCSYVATGAMVVATVGSFVSYLKAYIPLIDFNK